MPTDRKVSQVSGQAGNVAASAETAVIVTAMLAVNQPAGQGVLIEGTLAYLAGTSTTAVVARIRAGNGTTGTILVSATFTVTAGNTIPLALNWLDTTALVGTFQYTLTLQQTGGAATGNANGTLTSHPIGGV